MRVLADGRWKGRHGIGRYALEVISRLRASGVSLEELDAFALFHPLEPLLLSYQIARRRPDVYFSPGFNPPLWSTTPFVFTIHDVIHLRFAQNYGLRQRAYYQAVVAPAVRRASAVITVSEFSKREILEWVAVPESKVQVISPGVAEQFSTEIEPPRLPYQYLLYVGNRKPHKNLPRLLEAFARAELGPTVRLALSGAADRETVGIIEMLALGDRVLFLGELTDAELAGLYRGAVALVLPSLLEGFGLPALEAMACGAPVIASNSSSIPEVVGDAGLLFDPYNVGALAEAMQRVVSDAGLRARMASEGLERAKMFSWEETARRTLQVLGDASRDAVGR